MVAQGSRPAHLFVDYNQNARDHTIAAAYSVRGNAEATVSTPIALGGDRRLRTRRLHHRHGSRAVRRAGGSAPGIDEHAFDIAPLLEWADRDEGDGDNPSTG